MTETSETWYTSVIEESHCMCSKYIEEWAIVVNILGLEPKVRLNWISILKNHLEDLLKDFVADAKMTQYIVMENIEKLLQKSEVLCKTLHVKMPKHGSPELSLYAERNVLEKLIADFEATIEIKRKEQADLFKKQANVCKILDQPPKFSQEGNVLTDKEIDDLKTYIDNLETLRFSREEEFLRLKGEILEISKELEIQPSLEMNKSFINIEDDILLSDGVMLWLENYHKTLKENVVDMREEIGELRIKLRSLWEIISEDIQIRDEFLQQYPGNSRTVYKALKKEILRCEDLKKANIEVFIKKLRDEIVSYWDKCHYTDLQREECNYHHNDFQYNEDLLTLHDIELDNLKKFYNDNKKIFELLDEHNQLWSKLLELEERAKAPDRFKNRGGQLLQEEKQRNTVAKKIPNIEQELVELANNYMQINGKPFLSHGITIQQFIDELHENRESNKQAKLSERKMNRDVKMITPGKSMLSLVATGSTLNLNKLSTPIPADKPAAKRRLLTPHNTREKRFKCASEKKLGKKVVVEQENREPNTLPPYDDFTNCINTKLDGGRSTMIPVTDLAVPLCTVSAVKTPPRKATPRNVTPSKSSSKLKVAPALKLIF